MSSPEPAEDFRILVIDDQPANLELVEQLLARVGLHNVLCCTDPAQALALFSSFEPDLLILDLHMPGLDGFAVLEQLQRRIPADDYLPILVLTADATREAAGCHRDLAAGVESAGNPRAVPPVTSPATRSAALAGQTHGAEQENLSTS